ncbi:hypothetical protein T03_10335 [Trichinella britovi]|uniref:Uncharacterized protein n=1 Tax=Trichinella britovi TaxID=45882 RepID=A0A0V1APM6_TRIBR|nr:hypothetical protein T03_10335 [Trichinella britovi]
MEFRKNFHALINYLTAGSVQCVRHGRIAHPCQRHAHARFGGGPAELHRLRSACSSETWLPRVSGPGEATANGAEARGDYPHIQTLCTSTLLYKPSPDGHLADNGNTTCSLLPCVSACGRLPEGTLCKRQYCGHPCISGSCC